MLTSGVDGDNGGNSGNSAEDKWQLEKETEQKLTLSKQYSRVFSHKSLMWFEAYALKM